MSTWLSFLLFSEVEGLKIVGQRRFQGRIINPMLFLWVLIAFTDLPKENRMEIYPDSTKTYSREEVYSLQELKSLYERVAKKTPQRKDLDRNKADVFVCVDAENHVHFRPLLTDEWIRIDDPRTLDTKLAENMYRDCSFMPVSLVLDPKSDPEAAGKIVQFILEENKYVELTLMFGRRVLPRPEKSKK
jgi:hypothetical protein